MSPIWILAQTYPSPDQQYQQSYIHTRLLFYKSQGLECAVLSFSARVSYEYEGISIFSLGDFEALSIQKIDLLISHAPNMRNHIRFMVRYQKQIQEMIWFIHGHEVLIKHHYYPKPYAFQSQSHLIRRVLNGVYDHLKVRILKWLIQSWFKHLHLVFVSRWMQDAYFECVGTERQATLRRASIIANAIHPVFLEQRYQPNSLFKADFVTIRLLDLSKYAIDIVVALARANPLLTFDVYGEGDYFKHHQKPDNLRHFPYFMTPQDIPSVLDQYRCALMPTRLDAQGVMMCEMASYGIPVITSDLPICQEMLAGFENSYFIDNQDGSQPLGSILESIHFLGGDPRERFSEAETVQKEIDLIRGFEKD